MFEELIIRPNGDGSYYIALKSATYDFRVGHENHQITRECTIRVPSFDLGFTVEEDKLILIGTIKSSKDGTLFTLEVPDELQENETV